MAEGHILAVPLPVPGFLCQDSTISEGLICKLAGCGFWELILVPEKSPDSEKFPRNPAEHPRADAPLLLERVRGRSEGQEDFSV